MISAGGGSSHAAMVDRYWEFSPYKVHLLVSYQTSVSVKSRLEVDLPQFLKQRARVAYGPLWKLTIDESPAISLDQITEEQLAVERQDYDKLMLLVVREGLLGVEVTAQEYDCLLETAGAVISDRTSDLRGAEELCFSALERAFSPLATFSIVRETPETVQITFRGSALPRSGAGEAIVQPGMVLKPVLRRVDREGQPVENGIQPVEWTFLSVNAPEEEPSNEGRTMDTPRTAAILSHTRQPFGVRQRGRVDQLAAVVRGAGDHTTLRLHARDAPDVPLPGFPVYQRDTDSGENRLVGKTDRDGRIEISAGRTPVQFVFVQSSGQWIAKIPVVPTADRLVEAPLLDDRKRLEAEARLTAIREELIDIVARRNIIASRVRGKLRAGDIEGARKLVHELEDMPSASEFEIERIRKQERLTKSDDPRVQARIEKMFDDTRAVLAEFLPPGLFQELKDEITAASKTTTAATEP